MSQPVGRIGEAQSADSDAPRWRVTPSANPPYGLGVVADRDRIRGWRGERSDLAVDAEHR